MRFVLESAAKDLRRRLKDPTALALWIGIPVMIVTLISLLGTGSGTLTARVLVVDQDESFVSGLLTGMGGQQGVGEFLDTEIVTLEEGLERIDGGDGSALLIIPEGFGQAVLDEEPVELTLVTNPAQTIFPRIIEDGLEILIEGVFYAQRLIGPPLRATLGDDTGDGEQDGDDDGPSLEQVTTISAAFYERIESVEMLVFPPAMLLEEEASQGEEDEEDSGGGFDVARFFVPSFLFMSVLFVAQGMSDDLWHEATQGTLRRILVSPRSPTQLLAGKVLAGGAIMTMVASVAIAIAWWRLDISVVRIPGALLWCAVSGMALLTYFLAIQSLARDQAAGALVTNLILFPALMIGGSFFPLAAMPEWLASIGRRTPNGMALTFFEQIVFEQPTLNDLLVTSLILGVPAVLAFLFCASRLRRPPFSTS